MSFNEFFKKFYLKNRATSNIKIHKVLKKMGLDSEAGVYLRDGPAESDIGIVNLHPSKGTHWFCCINENCFDSYGCVCPKRLSKFIIKRNGYCLYSEYQIQKSDSFCASYCLYIIYLTKVFGVEFKSAVLIFYYQRFSEY